MDGPKQDGYSSIGCSIHPGEPVHKYCQECRVLLCFSCVTIDGQKHSQHQKSLVPYKTFVKEREKEALKMLQRLKELRARADHFGRLLTSYKANFEKSYKESEGYLESFETVKDSTRQWKRDLIEELDSKKEEQVRNINERISQTREGIVTSKKIEVKLPTVTVFLPHQREMHNKILNLVPRSYTGFSSRGSSERKRGSRYSYSKSSVDDMASLHSITSSVFSQVSQEDEHTYDEVDSLTSHQTMELGETAFYKTSKPPPLSLTHNTNDDIRNRPKHPTPIKKKDSKKELYIEQAMASMNPSPPAPSEDLTYSYAASYDPLDKDSLFSLQAQSITHDPIEPTHEPATESGEVLEELTEDGKQELEEEAEVSASEEEEREEEREEEGLDPPPLPIPTVAIEGVAVNENEDIPKNDDYDHIESEQTLPTAQSPVPTPRSRSRADSSPSTTSGEILYVSPNDVRTPAANEAKYLILKKEVQSQVKCLLPPPLPPPRRSIYSTPAVSPIAEYEYPDPHPLAGEGDQCTFTESYDTLLPADEPLYDDIEYLQMNKQQESTDAPPDEYTKPLDGVPFPVPYQPLTHAGQTDDNDDGLTPYENVSQPSPSRSIPATLPREMIIQPEQIIMASCMAENPTETVCLYDLCISSDGYMIFSDKTNNCLRCMLGTSQESKTITKHFKEGVQPRAVTFDNCNHRILMSSSQGLYQVKCSSHLSKMRETRLSKDMIPLSMACSTIPVAKTKSQSLMYVTLWPTDGESCAYRFDNDGHYQSRISSPDISNKKPHGIDYMKEYLVITCLHDGTLAKISHRGDSLWPETVDARRPGVLNHPFGVAILPRSEYIAVTEAQGHRVSIFSDKGKLILRLGEKGTDRGKFDTPRGIGVRMAKELVIVDCGNQRIQIFTLSSLNLPAFRTSSLDYQTNQGYMAVGLVEAATYYKLPSY